LPHALVVASGLERRRLALFVTFGHHVTKFWLSFDCRLHLENDVANLTKGVFFYQILTLHDVCLMLQNWQTTVTGHYKKPMQMLQKKHQNTDYQRNQYFSKKIENDAKKRNAR